ncbi:MAG: hypothetical protein RR478_02485 [Bacilli bacterium]
MNGQNSNNLNNGIGLDPTSLGNVEPVESLEPTPQVQNVQPLENAQPVEPIANSAINGQPYVAQPIPGTTNEQTVNSNGFVEPNKVENIGTVPPPVTNNNKKKQKPINKVLFIILIVALIGGVAYGVYYYLSLSKPKVTVKTKPLVVDVDAKLSDNINDYATITGSSSANCVLNTTNVDTKIEGEYTYKVTCGKESFSGKIIVKDTVGPSVTLKDVYAQINGTIKPEDFVSTCSEKECTYSFKDKTLLETNLQKAGTYEVDVIVADKKENKTDVKGQLFVLPEKVKLVFSCSSKEEKMTSPIATKTINDRFPINDINNYLGYSTRLYKYVFADETTYKTAVGEKKSTITFDNITGRAAYDDKLFTLEVTTNLTEENLNKEYGKTFPKGYAEISTYYEGTKKYTCTFEA